MALTQTARVYGLPERGAWVAAVEADETRARFLAASTSLTRPNEVHLLDAADSDELTRVAVCPHPGAVARIAPHPERSDCFASVYLLSGAAKLGVWQVRGGREGRLEGAGEGAGLTGAVTAVGWSGAGRRLLALDGGGLRAWDVPTPTPAETVALPGAGHALVADPHFASLVAVAADAQVVGVDLRQRAAAWSVRAAEHGAVRDVDANPNKPYQLASGGDDGKVRFWDYRSGAAPLKVLPGHAHWVTAVKYNRVHDQYVLTASTDHRVKLWNVLSISSVFGLTKTDEAASKRQEDHLVATFDEHEESVYSLAWSRADTWMFASLSHDGRLVVNYVPQAEQDKVLFTSH